VRQFCATVSLLLAFQFTPASAQTQLRPGYDNRPALGAEAATGAVIYSHGLAREGDPISATPYAVDDLQAAGWDVFRLERSRSEDTLEGSVPALADAVRKLRGDGYKRIVLVGQSFGGWISLAAAQGDAAVDAVVALAPAAFGPRGESPSWNENADALYPLAGQVSAARVLVFLFRGDEFDPGGRADRLREIFAARRMAAAVIDRPHDLVGHAAGLTRAFARRFGPCIRDFIASAEAEPLFVCHDPPVEALADFALPPDLPSSAAASEAATATAGAGVAAMAGRWYGAYENGREVLLTVTADEGEAARAVYSFGPVIRGIETPTGFTQRRGTFDPATGLLTFAEPQAENVIMCRLLADDVMALAIGNRASGSRLRAVLRRIP
jgi:dienelactone hydrolase